MDIASMLWPSDEMDFWIINNNKYKVTIKWSHLYFEDYKKLSYQYYDCAYSTFNEVIDSGDDNSKSDMWFLVGIFLLRQSIELGLKALLCRVCKKNTEIQSAFEICCHDVSALYSLYERSSNEAYLEPGEIAWLKQYLNSIELVDGKSDMFRFPFADSFLGKYRDKFLDNVDVANNMLQAFNLIKKCIEKGTISAEEQFDNNLAPDFFVFASHGIGNCYLWQGLSDDGFHVKVTGYISVIDYIYNSSNLLMETKVYPLLFMFRNALELCLKRLFYVGVEDGVSMKIFNSKRKSHLIKKDLWKNVKPIIFNYAEQSQEDTSLIDIVEKHINIINTIDKNGDVFRYPTSYSLEYRFDNVTFDLENVYKYFRAIINFLNGCHSMLDKIAEYEADMRAEYMANNDWY